MTTKPITHSDHGGGGALALTDDRHDLIARTIAKGSTPDELELFLFTAQRLGLDPLARQIFSVKRWNARERREVMSIQVSVDGFRVIAERSCRYAGQLGPFWCGQDGEWREVWLEKSPPAAAKVAVLRTDFREPLWSVATWDQYVQTKASGELSGLWARMPALMLGKCAESLALRRGFPAELSGVYSPEEMGQAGGVIIEHPDVDLPAQPEGAAPQALPAPAPEPEPSADERRRDNEIAGWVERIERCQTLEQLAGVADNLSVAPEDVRHAPAVRRTYARVRKAITPPEPAPEPIEAEVAELPVPKPEPIPTAPAKGPAAAPPAKGKPVKPAGKVNEQVALMLARIESASLADLGEIKTELAGSVLPRFVRMSPEVKKAVADAEAFLASEHHITASPDAPAPKQPTHHADADFPESALMNGEV